MKIWLEADSHYFHDNIRKFCNRPFATVEEMNQTLIENHNDVVGMMDIVYHIGDFSLGTSDQTSEIIAQLNGIHHFIPGSHDYWIDEYRHSPFDIKSLNGRFIGIDAPIVEFKYDDNYIVLCHYAMRVWARKHYGAYHFYGHSHGKLPNFERSCDVGVDVVYFAPISLDDAIAKLNAEFEWKKEF